MPYKIEFRPVYENELYHHGVLGQKWGVRRYQNKDGSYTTAGREHYGIGNSHRDAKKVGMDSETKTELIATTAVTALYLAPFIAAAAKIQSHKNFEKKCNKEKANAKTDPETGLKIIDPPKTDKENVKRVNPKYYTSRDPEYFNNCVNCTIAMELRTRGFEVQAKPCMPKDPQVSLTKCFKPEPKKKAVVAHPGDKLEKKYNLKTDDDYNNLSNEQKQKYMSDYKSAWDDLVEANGPRNRNLIAKFHSQFSKEPPGSRGQLSLYWGPYGGHSLAYSVSESGEVYILDAQSGEIIKGNKLDKYLRHAQAVEYRRLDNLELLPKGCREEAVR